MELTPQKLGFSPTIAGWMTNLIFLFIIYNCRSTLHNYFSGEYKVVNILTLCYCLWMIYSTFNNQTGSDAAMYMEQLKNKDLNVLEVKVVFWKAMTLFTVVLFIETVCILQMVQAFLKIAFYVLFIYVIYLDLFMFTGHDRDMYGGKFIISYVHLYLVVIYYRLHPMLQNKSLYIYYALLVGTVYICLYMRCSTMMVALIPFFLLTIWKPLKKRKSRLYSLSFFLITLVICDGILFLFSSWLLSFKFVQTFIVDVLHEDLTLTGRLGIYGTIGEVFGDSPWYGMGIGNYLGVTMILTGCANAQNGIINLFLEVGVIGCALFICWLSQLIKKARLYNVSYPIIAFIYAELVISMVEIPFSYMSFWIMSTFLLLHNKNDLIFPIIKKNVK